MSITFAAKAETAKDALRRKIKTEALSYFNAKQYDKALDLYLQIADSMEKGQIDYMIGMCYMSSSESHKALAYLKNAASSNENTFVVNYYLGKAYFNLGDYSNALTYLNDYVAALDKCNGLVFKKANNVPDNHKVHYEKSKKDVSKVIEICKTKLPEGKFNPEASKANVSESNIYDNLIIEDLQAIPAAR